MMPGPSPFAIRASRGGRCGRAALFPQWPTGARISWPGSA